MQLSRLLKEQPLLFCFKNLTFGNRFREMLLPNIVNNFLAIFDNNGFDYQTNLKSNPRLQLSEKIYFKDALNSVSEYY